MIHSAATETEADHFMDGELRALSDTLAVHCNGSTAVEVQTITITAELISKQVDTSTLQHHSQVD